jgi:hypothetical protein
LNFFVEKISQKTRISPPGKCSEDSKYGENVFLFPGVFFLQKEKAVQNPVGPALNFFVEKISQKTRISPPGKCSEDSEYMGHPSQNGNT